jgi:hypothetical protein
MTTVQQIGNGGGVAVVGALFYAIAAGGSVHNAFLVSLGVLAVAIALTAGTLSLLGRARS